MPYQKQIVDPFRKGVSQLMASAGFMIDGMTIPSTTAPWWRVDPSAGTAFGRKIFDLKRKLLQERHARR